MSRSICVTTLLLIFCAAAAAQTEPETPPSPPPAAAGESEAAEGATARDPNWFEEILAREAEPLKERPLASEDGIFRTRVPAEVVSKPVLEEGVYFVQLNMGTEAPMECWIYPEGRDMASVLRLVSDNVFELIAAAQGEIDMKAVTRIEAGIFGAHPYIALDWLYRVKSEQGVRAGQVKHVAANKDKSVVYCVHTETGYSETFERVFRALVDRLEVDVEYQEPYYLEIHKVSLNGLDVGVGTMAWTRDEDGDTKSVEKLSMLVPIEQGTLLSNDTYHIQFSSPGGKVLNELEVEAENGQLLTQLKLEPAPDGGGWQVSGTFESRHFESTPEPKELLSVVGQMRALRDFVAKAEAGDRTSFWEWNSDPDPAGFLEVRIQARDRTPEGLAVGIEMGGPETDAILDATGSAKSLTVREEGVEMKLDRVYVAGAPRLGATDG